MQHALAGALMPSQDVTLATLATTAQVFAPALNVNLATLVSTAQLFPPRAAQVVYLGALLVNTSQVSAPPLVVLQDPPPVVRGWYIIRAGQVMANTGWLDHFNGTDSLVFDTWSADTGDPSVGPGHTEAGIHLPVNPQGEFLLQFKGDSIVYLDIFTDDPTFPDPHVWVPWDRIDLPSGFTPITAMVFANTTGLWGGDGSGADVYLRFDAFTQEGPNNAGSSGGGGQNQQHAYYWAHPLDPVPSLDDLIFYGFGMRVIPHTVQLGGVIYLQITGAYTIVETTLTTTIRLPAWAASTAHLQPPSIVRGPAPAPPLQQVGGPAPGASTAALFTPSVVLEFPNLPGEPGGPGSWPPGGGPPSVGSGCPGALPVDSD